MIISRLDVDTIRTRAAGPDAEAVALARHLDARAAALERPGTDDQDHGIAEAVRHLLLGLDPEGSILARACSVETAPLFRSAVEALGLDVGATAGLPRLAGDLRIDDDAGRMSYAAWTGGDGATSLRAALGGGVHVTGHGDILIPDLPETLILTLRGRRAAEIVEHPLIGADLVVEAVVTRRLWGDTLMRALQTGPARGRRR